MHPALSDAMRTLRSPVPMSPETAAKVQAAIEKAKVPYAKNIPVEELAEMLPDERRLMRGPSINHPDNHDEVAVALIVLHTLQRLHDHDTPTLNNEVWTAINRAEDAVKDFFKTHYGLEFPHGVMHMVAEEEEQVGG